MRAMGAICNICGARVEVQITVRKDRVVYRVVCPEHGKIEGGSDRRKVS